MTRWRNQSPLAARWLWLGAAVCLVAALALLVVGGLPQRADYSGFALANGQVVAPEIGALAPPFQADTLNGTLNFADLHGAPVVINFWATWCAPCRAEMPELQALHAAHPNLRVLAINLGESPQLVVDWAARLELTYDLLLDPHGEIAAAYRLRGQPSTYIVSPGGVITNIYYGATTRQALEAALAPFLGDEP